MMEEQADIFNNQQVRWGVVFYALYLFVCLLIKNTSWFNSYDHLFWMELLLALITIVFAAANYSKLQPVLSFRSIRLSGCLTIIVLAILFSCITNLLITILHISVRNAGTHYYRSFSGYFSPWLVMVYSVALMPAVFEELAFRGVLYQYFSAVTDERRVVLITAVIFSAMHLNALSLIWLFPLGLLLGYLRKKHHTVWYGVLFHFTFNFLICLQALYRLPLPFSAAQ